MEPLATILPNEFPPALFLFAERQRLLLGLLARHEASLEPESPKVTYSDVTLEIWTYCQLALFWVSAYIVKGIIMQIWPFWLVRAADLTRRLIWNQKRVPVLTWWWYDVIDIFLNNFYSKKW